MDFILLLLLLLLLLYYNNYCYCYYCYWYCFIVDVPQIDYIVFFTIKIESFVMSLQRVKIEMSLPISPKYLDDPSTSIFKQLSKHLLLYSHILSGFPLSFQIEGVLPKGKILDDGSVYSVCLISFYVFKVTVGDVISCVDGCSLGIFTVQVEEEEDYTGDIIVKEIEGDTIKGIRKEEEEDEF